jgi:hypothetical protein
LLIASALALLLALQAAPPSPFERFFIGATEGSGTVSVIFSGNHGMRHRARGWMDGHTTLVLDEVVEEDGKPARKRSWRLVRSGDNKITGSINDAKGPVTGEISGNNLNLRYRLTEGPSVEQTITLHASGRSASNRMTFRRFGMRVATVESMIRKVE